MARNAAAIDLSAHEARAAPFPGRRDDTELHVTKELWFTRLCLLATVSSFGTFVVTALAPRASEIGTGGLASVVWFVMFGALVTFLVYGNVVHQLCRLGHLRRLRRHRPAPPERLRDLAVEGPPVVVLVPSFKEETAVVRQTLLSAVLQEYDDMRVVLLVDDPPTPRDAADRRLLESVRALPRDIDALLSHQRERVRTALDDHRERQLARTSLWSKLVARRRQAGAMALAAAHEETALWLESIAATEPMVTHTDALFVEQVLLEAARRNREAAEELLARVLGAGPPVSSVEIDTGYRRMLASLSCEISVFERKRFENLSHEPNKAMNLNSYIGLLGGVWREVRREGELHLERAADVSSPGAVHVPDAAFVVTLDADSLLVPDYVVRLVDLMLQPGNERVAVTQTPYSAVPGATDALERIAGATTDIQYGCHQGFTEYGATFWVGANAVIRRAALDDVRTIEVERGHVVQRFIQDRTVIEDTESSIDLVRRGWTLVNYPARLSYSATPPDFGSLIIQRRRWANGGLIILPKLLAYALRGRPSPSLSPSTGRRRARRRRPTVAEMFVRSHYLTSIAGANVGLVVLLTIPFDVESIWLPVTAAPYFWLYARELRQAGYRRRDVLWVYALNLLLVPVNLAGVLKSVEQAVTRRKIPFGRTPKVEGRTAAPRLYLLAPLLFVAHWTAGATFDLLAGRPGRALLATCTAALLLAGISRFIGWRNLVADVRPRRLRPPSAAAAPVTIDLRARAHLDETTGGADSQAAATGTSALTSPRA